MGDLRAGKKGAVTHRVIKPEDLRTLEGEDLAVLKWRTEQFEALGFERTVAKMLAMTPDVDLHQVRKLVADGATHEQVLQIVL
jgi:hypothetical protein